ncbi:MAG: hypothetical protein KF791_00970 [Verrucomicrobiae bacterium]|nr:hypothetical protein [Verrucomicrobiae bacterium]
MLNLSVKSGNVVVTGQVLDKDAGDAVIFERTYVDTPAADVLAEGQDDPPAPFINEVGNFVLYLYADGGNDPAGYQVVLDNAETFLCDAVLLDDFNAPQRSGWTDSDPAGLGLPGGKQADGSFTFDLGAMGGAFFVGSTKTSPTFELAEGTRHEFAVDLVSGRGPDSFAVLAFIPQRTGPMSLAGYGIAKSETDLLITKGINKHFFNANVNPAVKNENVRLVLTLTVKGGNVIVRGQVLDLDDAGAVLFDRTYVDTPGSDVLAEGEDIPPEPFIAEPGHVVLYLYADGGRDPAGYQVVMDNLVACVPPVAADQPPRIEAASPEPGSIRLPASAQVTFRAVDDQPLPDGGFRVILNGQEFTVATGLSLSDPGTTRTATLGGLEADRTYVGRIEVSDAAGTLRTVPLWFDTFSAAVRMVEAEDYNFDGGGYLNDPERVPEGSGEWPNAYNDRIGMPDVDFRDTRAVPNGANTMYRTADPVRMQRALDNRRRDLFNNDLDIFDYEIGDLAAGEWMQYTRDFDAGSYEVYLRQSIINLERADSVLELVVGDPAQPEPAVRLLGSFLGEQTGFTARNVPLTDGTGQIRSVVRLEGRTTLRLRHLTADTATGMRYLNYLAFVPVADAGVQRAAVTSLSPANASVVTTTEPRVEAVLQDRDTRVVPESVRLEVNGDRVAPAVLVIADGVSVSHVFPALPPRDSVQVVRLVFADTDGVLQTNDWSFTITYLELDPATRMGAAGPERGFRVRVTQSEDAGDNSLERAEAQLAAGSSIPKVYDIAVVAPLINFSQEALFGGMDGYFEGDEPVPGQEEGFGNDNFAMEIFTFLELPAGVTRFGVRSDDGFKLSSGIQLGAASPVLAFRNGGPADQEFDVVVPVAGTYGFRMVWYERGGAAHVEWFTVDRTTGQRSLVNAAGSVPAYTSAAAPAGIQALGAASLNGPFLPVPVAVVDLQNRTVTVPATDSVGFLRLASEVAITIRSAELSGDNLTLRFE